MKVHTSYTHELASILSYCIVIKIDMSCIGASMPLNTGNFPGIIGVHIIAIEAATSIESFVYLSDVHQ